MTSVTAFELPLWHWKDTQDSSEELPQAAPTEPTPGQGWFDPDAGTLYVWSGNDWVSVPQD